jgi:hypothetical protein
MLWLASRDTVSGAFRQAGIHTTKGETLKNSIFSSVAILSIVIVAGCAQQPAEQSSDSSAAQTSEAPAMMPGGHTGTVLETMNAGTYTYVRLDLGEEEIWAAGPATTIEVGAEVTIPPGMAMENFHSDSLDREFPVIYFVEAIWPAGAAPAAQPQMPAGHPTIEKPSAEAAEVDLGGIQPAAGGVTVAGLYESKESLAGQQVTLRGKVVKVNLGIMGKNWIHVQDGSGDAAAGSNDITVTTDGVAEVGDTVLVSGTLTVDKDFGAGYRYAAIIEDATVKVE